MAQAQTLSKKIDHIIELYGDLVYDLCISVLWSTHAGQSVFKNVMRELKFELKSSNYYDYKRAWVLKTVFEKLSSLEQKTIPSMTPAEQIMLDTYLNIEEKFKQFDSYFHRLPLRDKFLLLLRDKYGLPYPEISSAMGLPVDTLKTQRQLAYRALEEWIWIAS